MAVYGLAGVPGMILGGLLGDAMLHRRRNGRMLVAAFAIAFSVPLMWFALERPAGEWFMFSVLFGLGCMMMYVYYATVYSTIQDVIEPSLRATAMALYFFADVRVWRRAGAHDHRQHQRSTSPARRPLPTTSSSTTSTPPHGFPTGPKACTARCTCCPS